MDSKRTIYTKGISQIPDQQLAKVLAPIGLEKPYRLKGPTNRIADSVFLQFKSAAHIKAALVVLPQLEVASEPLEVIASQETKDWINLSAVNATVQSVTRMSAESLVAKLQTALNQASEEPIEVPMVHEEIKEDGTLTSQDFPEHLEDLRKGVREFREQTLLSTKLRDQRNKEVIEHTKTHHQAETKAETSPEPETPSTELEIEFDAFDEREVLTSRPKEAPDSAWAKFLAKNEARQAMYESKKAAMAPAEADSLEFYLNYQDKGFRGDPKQRQLERAHELKLDQDVALGESSDSSESEAEKEPEKISLAIKKGPAWHEVSEDYIAEHIRPALGAKIEELFGELDESLLEFMEGLIRDQKSQAEMAEDLEAPLDDEAAEVAEQIYSLLPR